MDREILRRHFSALLMNTDNERHLKCDILLEKNAKVEGVFQMPSEGIIYFVIEGDCILEFDDMADDDLITILNTLKEQYRIETKVFD